MIFRYTIYQNYNLAEMLFCWKIELPIPTYLVIKYNMNTSELFFMKEIKIV